METPNANGLDSLPAILTPRQVAQLLNVPVATLAIWRSTGRVDLPYFKLGHHVRYLTRGIARHIQRNLRNGPTG